MLLYHVCHSGILVHLDRRFNWVINTQRSWITLPADQILRGYFLHIIYAHDAAVSFITRWLNGDCCYCISSLAAIHCTGIFNNTRSPASSRFWVCGCGIVTQVNQMIRGCRTSRKACSLITHLAGCCLPAGRCSESDTCGVELTTY